MLEPNPRAFDEGPIGQELIQIELGLKSWPSRGAKRHHFISRFLLNRFASANERLFQLDQRTGKPQGGISTDKAASRHRFYEFEDEDGNKSSALEGLFAVVEDAAAPALQRLEEEGDVDEIDRATISMFLAFLWARTPAARERAEKLSQEVAAGLMASKYADRRAFREMLQQHEAQDEAVRLTDEEAEALRQDTLRMLGDGTLFLADPDGGATTGLLISTANDVALVMFGGMEWTLMRAHDVEFITSDRGAASFDPTPKHPWSSHTIHSSPNAETFFPISSEYCLVISPGQPVVRTSDVNRAKVMETNLRIYGWADRYIYGRSQEAVAAVRRARKRKPQLAAPPEPHRGVMLIDRDPDDERLAHAHLARGWPPYMIGIDDHGMPQQLDYLVVGEEGNAVEIALNADDLIRQRALKEAGYPPDSDIELPGGIGLKPVDPGTIKPSLW
jgi:hypothetical protein